MDTLHLPSEQVQTVYNGYNPRFRPLQKEETRATKHYMPHDDFLFFLGNTDPKKNTRGVLQAYASYLERSGVQRPLLIADLKEEYLDTLLKAEHLEHIRHNIFCPGYIRNEDLPSIYNSAFAFLYPSLRESFGIPMIEAMACGTPAIVSTTSAMPEVAGEGALLVDPFKPETITDALIKLESDDTYRNELTAYGLKQAQRYSWKATAEAWIKVYEDVLNSTYYH